MSPLGDKRRELPVTPGYAAAKPPGVKLAAMSAEPDQRAPRRPDHMTPAARPVHRGDYVAPPTGRAGNVTDAVSVVPGSERWSYGPFEFDAETGRRTVPLVRDDGAAAAFTIPEFVSEPSDLQAIAHIVIAACERWENREGVGG